MATQQVQYSFTIEDQLGTKASLAIYSTMSDATTGAQLASEWEALAVLLDAIVGGQVLHGNAAIVLEPTGDEKTAPAAGSRVEQTAVFGFPSTISGRKFGLAVPSLSDSKIVSGQINLADTDVAAFVTAIEGTYTASGVFTNNNFQQLGDLVDSFLSFRKRRRQLFRSSLEIPA